MPDGTIDNFRESTPINCPGNGSGRIRQCVEPGAEPEILRHAHFRVERRALGKVPHDSSSPASMCLQVMPPDLDRSLARRENTTDHPHGSGLPGPVVTQEAHYRTGLNVQAEVVYGDNTSEPFDQSPCDDSTMLTLS